LPYASAVTGAAKDERPAFRLRPAPIGLLFLGLCLTAIGCSASAESSSEEVEVSQINKAVVVATHPHDSTAYTQGLEFVGGQLLESTGRIGESSLRLVEPATGRVTSRVAVDELFAEGATVVGDAIYQLTWTEETLIVYDLDGLTERGRQSYEGEGWGLCLGTDGLVMSNGSSELTVRDRETFEVLDVVPVTDADGRPVVALNELECVEDRVWANIYQSDEIIEIDPATGQVTRSVDLSALVPDQYVGDSDNVLNGIAYDDETGRFWLTGKRWPVIYEVELVPAP